ncbi:MAG: epoxyqueuosine reductase QueH [Lachnospiraceae bacterium]|nr:epoxyqueuosine reductase QueH [Lachnospiraceae bacterium]
MNQNQKKNYQRELDRILKEIKEAGRVPRLLLHSCCAPCSSYVLEYLSQYFEITDFYYNPNITEEGEYRKRAEELQRLIAQQPHLHPVQFVCGDYEPTLFFESVRGLEKCREGGERCLRCFEMRLRKTAELAACGIAGADGERKPFDFFATTLTISPLKDEQALNRIGRQIEEQMREEAEQKGENLTVRWLPSDFKKKGGYQRSTELSREYELYRQDYCGCIFSKRRDYLPPNRGEMSDSTAPEEQNL